MPPRQKIPAPIDRPLSRAYLREFTGWHTADPPGLADPTSLREMENIIINGDGSAGIRPGMRYLSYEQAPGSGEGVSVTVDLETLAVRGSYYKSSGVAPVSTTELALPSGTQVGDFLTLMVLGQNSGGKDAAVPASICTDERFEVYEHLSGTNWWGTVTTLDPIEIAVTAGMEVIVASFYDTSGATPLVATSDVYHVTKGDSTGDVMDDIELLAMPTRGVVVLITEDVGTTNTAPLPTGYSHAQPGEESDINFWTGDAPSPAWTWVEGSGYQRYDKTISVLPLAIEVASAEEVDEMGFGTSVELVGTQEPFYLNDGTKAYLQAVRETDGTVGFRVFVIDVNDSTMYALTDPLVNFDVRQEPEVFNYSADCTYVTYVQIDNKIFSLSDTDEPMRVFYVGEHKEAKALAAIQRPTWNNADRLEVVHPDAAWIEAGELSGYRVNLAPNPSFETNINHWTPWPLTLASRQTAPAGAIVSGNRTLALTVRPERVNLAKYPLTNVAVTETTGWNPRGVELSVDGTYMRIQMPAKKGEYYARSMMFPGIEGGETYRVAFDKVQGPHLDTKVKVEWLGVTGTQLGPTAIRQVNNDTAPGRAVTAELFAPKNAVSARIYLGGENTQNDATQLRVKNVVLARSSEPTSIFTGDDGPDYYWHGAPHKSAAYKYTPSDIGIISNRIDVLRGKALSASVHVTAGTTPSNVILHLLLFDKYGKLLDTLVTSPTPDTVGTPLRLDIGSSAIPNNAVKAAIRVQIENVGFGEVHYLDGVQLEPLVDTPGDYFDGDTTNTGTEIYQWYGAPNSSMSVEYQYDGAGSIPDKETRTEDTLIGLGGPAVNKYLHGFFYTFSNEVGESAASNITVRRTQRAYPNWVWETPNAEGEPSGTTTNDPERAADQLVAYMPEDIYHQAMAEGAIKWNLYMFSWSDQDAQPVTAWKVATKELPDDGSYESNGWIRIPPGLTAGDVVPIPTQDTRYNYSDPSHAAQGLVASDRMILVNDPSDAGVIRWSSNQQGDYTNFTAHRGGGYKTLTSGNLYIPAAVKLWQNPQSADTITILCLGTDGQSVSYYMAPAQVASQSEAVNIMGFEETTNTPGTVSPYGVEVFNNALYHPLDDQLMKSTASNYNINHKSMTDPIKDMWEKLATKYWIMSAQHEGRLYYLVNNLTGQPLEHGCKGNEIWVYDASAKDGNWSRFLIQGHTLRQLEYGGRVYMSVTRPDGIYFLDPAYEMDDYLDAVSLVRSKAIPWKLVTNTQGANRAHDAWAHLQQVNLTLGYFQGRCRYGIRSTDIHGKPVEISKIVKDTENPIPLSFDIEDHLLVRRDLKEWYFFAESLTDEDGNVEPSYGQLSLVQYRYTPSTVNTGYELGSVETFEYGRDVAQVDSNTTNGIPQPLTDIRRP